MKRTCICGRAIIREEAKFCSTDCEQEWNGFLASLKTEPLNNVPTRCQAEPLDRAEHWTPWDKL